MKKKLEAAAEAENVGQSEIVRSAINEYLQDTVETSKEELARIHEKIDETEREAQQHQKKAEERRERIEDLREREKELTRKMDKVAQLDTLADMLERIAKESIEEETSNTSQHQSLTKETSANYNVDEQEIIKRIYTEYPEIPESEFHHRELDESWSREWPDDYDYMLTRMARLTRWKGELCSHEVRHISQNYDVQPDELLKDASTHSDDLELAQGNSDFSRSSVICLIPL
jgi:hypothetical protein